MGTYECTKLELMAAAIILSSNKGDVEGFAWAPYVREYGGEFVQFDIADSNQYERWTMEANSPYAARPIHDRTGFYKGAWAGYSVRQGGWIVNMTTGNQTVVLLRVEYNTRLNDVVVAAIDSTVASRYVDGGVNGIKAAIKEAARDMQMACFVTLFSTKAKKSQSPEVVLYNDPPIALYKAFGNERRSIFGDRIQWPLGGVDKRGDVVPGGWLDESGSLPSLCAHGLHASTSTGDVFTRWYRDDWAMNANEHIAAQHNTDGSDNLDVWPIISKQALSKWAPIHTMEAGDAVLIGDDEGKIVATKMRHTSVYEVFYDHTANNMLKTAVEIVNRVNRHRYDRTYGLYDPYSYEDTELARRMTGPGWPAPESHAIDAIIPDELMPYHKLADAIADRLVKLMKWRNPLVCELAHMSWFTVQRILKFYLVMQLVRENRDYHGSQPLWRADTDYTAAEYTKFVKQLEGTILSDIPNPLKPLDIDMINHMTTMLVACIERGWMPKTFAYGKGMGWRVLVYASPAPKSVDSQND